MNKIAIKKINATINGKDILKNVNFEANNNDIVAILGPNGAGKSTLLKTIMHHYSIKITSGKIIYNDVDITNLSTDKIANLGVYYAHQNPIEIEGIPMVEFLKTLINSKNKKPIGMFEIYKKVKENFQIVNLNEKLLERSLNVDFSGGEKKKHEIVQMNLLDPSLILIDEIDSGLDIDSVRKIGEILKNLKNKIIFIVSHQNELLNIVKPNKCIVLNEGQIAKTGGYDLVQKIIENGYGFLEKTQSDFDFVDLPKQYGK